MYYPHAQHALTTPHPFPTPAFLSTSHHHTLSADTHATQTTVHASQSQQPPHPHRVPRQPHRQTKDDHMATYTTQGHRPSSKSEINIIILQVNINGIKNSRSSNCLFTTHMQTSSQLRNPSSPLKSKHPKYITSQVCEPISQLQTFIYLLETTHPRTTKQLIRTYNTAYSTSRKYHTQSSPEM